ncbi:MAG TPA: hypothetical protein VJV04_02185 [Nitrospiraceae bacterium]|nr:hypothetical protein [Nitrospiraceae bacterium]
MKKLHEDVCGCGGPGVPAGENKPLFYLMHLVAMIEAQEEARRLREEKNPCPPKEEKP